MADKQSREVNFVSCNENDYCCTGKCAKGVDALPFDVQQDADEFWRKEDARESGTSVGEVTSKLSVDVSDVITGLKAVQREAKEATKALRELETQYEENGKRYYVKWRQSEHDDECTDIREVCMSDIPTKYLSRELAKREGVKYVAMREGSTLSISEGRTSVHFGEDGFVIYGVLNEIDKE